MEETILQKRIRQRLGDKGLSARAASLDAGLSEDAIRAILEGRSKSPRMSTLEKLAIALDCSVTFLTGQDDYVGVEPFPALLHRSNAARVMYEIAAERWLSNIEQLEGPEEYWISTPRNQMFANSDHENWIEIVRGNSANRIAPDGAMVHVINCKGPLFGDQRAPVYRDGDIVVVERIRVGGDKERTLRQIEIRGDEYLLWGRSYDERYNTCITAKWEDEFKTLFSVNEEPRWVAFVDAIAVVTYNYFMPPLKVEAPTDDNKVMLGDKPASDEPEIRQMSSKMKKLFAEYGLDPLRERIMVPRRRRKWWR